MEELYITDRYSAGKILVIGLSIMFILIGITGVLGVIFNPHNFSFSTGGWVGAAWGVLVILIDLFFLFIFIWVIVWFARSLGWMSRSYRYYSGGWDWWDHDDALEILRERYAKGEISKEEYDRMREDLEK